MEVELAQPVKRGMNIPLFAIRERGRIPGAGKRRTVNAITRLVRQGSAFANVLILKKLASIGMGELCCIR